MTNQITPAKQTTGCAGLVLECKLALKLVVHRNKSSFIRRTCGSRDLFCPWVGLCKSFRKLMLKVICRKVLVGNSPSLQILEDETWVARVACVRRGGKGERRAREAREDRGRIAVGDASRTFSLPLSCWLSSLPFYGLPRRLRLWVPKRPQVPIDLA